MKTLVTIFLALAITAMGTLCAQNQIGDNINGLFPEGQFGRALSMPSPDHVIVGAPEWGDGIGQVQVRAWDGGSWVQKGALLYGDSPEDYFGWSVDMPDENTIAVGAYMSDANGADAGAVRVYEYNGVDWIPKGNDIVGAAPSDICGSSISMPNANTIAVSATGNDSGGALTGHVRVFEWNGSSWTQKGEEITGENLFDQSGSSVSMPDENTVAIGARYNDDIGLSAGHVRVFEWDGDNWVQKGMDIDGEATGDNFGIDVSMPDPNSIAIGGYANDGNGTDSGHTRIYNWSGTNWVQVGEDIDGQNAGDLSGFSVSMPSPNTVAIGARYNSVNGNLSGQARVFQWTGSQWSQFGEDINGDEAGDNAGFAVHMPDNNTIAVGAPFNNGNGNNAGRVKVFSLCTPTFALITETACGSYLSPSGNYTWTTSGLYQDTIPVANGCDSLIGIDLTIIEVDVSVTNNSSELVANATGATYQWLDCDNGFEAIAGATEAIFTPLLNGNYAVEVTQNGCTDTSACVLFFTVGLVESSFGDELTCFPNPTNGAVTIALEAPHHGLTVVINNLLGREIWRKDYGPGSNTINLHLDGEAGVYFMEISGDNKKSMLKVIKEGR